MGPRPGGSRTAGDRVRRPGDGRVGPHPGRARLPGQGAGLTARRAYEIAYLQDVEVGPEIAEYIERIEATMAPYGGRFLVHGGRLVGLEGTWDGDIVMLEFPDMAGAQEWYASPDYQATLPLRTRRSTSIVALVEGVPDGYRAVDKIAQLFPQEDAVGG
ncbi:DUF1330 domain-containing protein [Streptomyces sp. NPDC050355]|uniref:DUF1330 domain-containing protein n=1 Tax=Streptomyces sp. NPDC050355 TaxID=3365609 RepID=UPI0037897303